MSDSLDAYLVLSVLLFCIGTFGFLARRNAIAMLMSIELMLNATNLQLIAFGRYFGNVNGQIFVFFVLVVAAAEAAIGLAIIVSLVRNYKDSLMADDFNLLKG